MPKNILIVGVLDVPGSTNIYMKKGFEALGHTVDEYNYRTVEKKLGTTSMWEDFKEIIKLRPEEYDLVVFCKTNSIHPALLHAAKEMGPTWYWFMDNMEVARNMHASVFAQNATFASATASNVTERFKMVNNQGHHIFEGYDPNVYYYEDLKKIHDCVFIGNATIPRVQAINELEKNGLKITIFGHGWPIGMKANGPVFAEDERIEICQSHYVLNLCHDDIIFSDRVMKSLACGANVVSQVTADLIQFSRTLPLRSECISDLDDADDFEWLFFSNGVYDIRSPKFPYDGETLKPTTYFHEYVKSSHSWMAVASKMLTILEKYNADNVRESKHKNGQWA